MKTVPSKRPSADQILAYPSLIKYKLLLDSGSEITTQPKEEQKKPLHIPMNGPAIQNAECILTQSTMVKSTKPEEETKQGLPEDLKRESTKCVIPEIMKCESSNELTPKANLECINISKQDTFVSKEPLRAPIANILLIRLITSGEMGKDKSLPRRTLFKESCDDSLNEDVGEENCTVRYVAHGFLLNHSENVQRYSKYEKVFNVKKNK